MDEKLIDDMGEDHVFNSCACAGSGRNGQNDIGGFE
jgi:hypothetical protein